MPKTIEEIADEVKKKATYGGGNKASEQENADKNSSEEGGDEDPAAEDEGTFGEYINDQIHFEQHLTIISAYIYILTGKLLFDKDIEDLKLTKEEKDEMEWFLYPLVLKWLNKGFLTEELVAVLGFISLGIKKIAMARKAGDSSKKWDGKVFVDEIVIEDISYEET